MKNLTVNEAIELAANLGFDEADLLAVLDVKASESERLACCYLLMACESHERKA